MDCSRAYGRKTNILTAAVLVAACYCFFKFTGPLYADIDNYYISQTTASVYSSDNWCYYVHPFLCYEIKLLSMLYQSADWFTVLTHFNIFIASVWAIYHFISSRTTRMIRAASVALIICCLICLSLWNANFTVQSAFFCFVGCIALFSTQNGKPLATVIPGCYFLLCGMAWRIESFLLFVPFIALKLAKKMFLARKHGAIPSKQFRAVLALLLIFGLGAGIHYSARQFPGHQASSRYNQARTELTDFPVVSWEEFPDKALLTEHDYTALTKKWFLLDTEFFNTELLEHVAELGRTNLSPQEAFITLLRMLWWNRSDSVLLASWLLFFSVLILSRQTKTDRIELLLALLGAGLIIFYFALTGRIPMRVIEAVWLACCFSLMESLLSAPVRNPACRSSQALCGLILVVSLVFTGLACMRAEIRSPQWALRSKAGNTDFPVCTYTVNGSDLFIWENYSYTTVYYYMDQGKLMDREFVKHNISRGDWLYGQPCMLELLASIHAENPARALLERDHTYFVSDDPDFMLTLLREHYGNQVQLIHEGNFLGGDYWSFSD